MNRPFLAALASACVALSPAHALEGPATWYGKESGKQTTSGQPFDENGDTCAMPHFRRGMPIREVRVTAISTGRSAICKVNDRGPADWTKAIIDVSKGIARKLGTVEAGRFRVRVDETMTTP